MEKTLYVAKKLYDMYFNRFGCEMEQSKMHKLMYFSNRESLMLSNEFLFDESFMGWKSGPVLLSVQNEYLTGHPFSSVSGDVSKSTKQLLESVLDRYGSLSSWKLNTLCHNEYSWQQVRAGLKSDDNGTVTLNENMMRLDAKRELAFRAKE